MKAAAFNRTSIRRYPRQEINLDTHKALCDATHMATNIELNDVLLSKAMKLGGSKTKKDAVNKALTEYVQRREQQKITELFGKIDYDEMFDYKEQRKIP